MYRNDLKDWYREGRRRMSVPSRLRSAEIIRADLLPAAHKYVEPAFRRCSNAEKPSGMKGSAGYVAAIWIETSSRDGCRIDNQGARL